MVGQWALNPFIFVRIEAPEQRKKINMLALSEAILDTRIRVIPVPIKQPAEIFHPNIQDEQSGILHSLRVARKIDAPYFQKSGFYLLETDSTKPHIPTSEHTVNWITERHRNDRISGWENRLLHKLIADADFLAGMDRHIDLLHRAKPGHEIYMVMGFVPVGKKLPDYFQPGGFASQKQLHFHVVKPNDSVPHERLLEWEKDEDLQILSKFYDLSMMRGLDYFDGIIRGIFGKEFTYFQNIGIPREQMQILPRTMFGFNSFGEALDGVIRLSRDVQRDDKWDNFAGCIFREGYQLGKVKFPLRTFSVPPFALIFPSDEDRKLGAVAENFKVWVQFGTQCGPISQLRQGGAYYPPKFIDQES